MTTEVGVLLLPFHDLLSEGYNLTSLLPCLLSQVRYGRVGSGFVSLWLCFFLVMADTFELPLWPHRLALVQCVPATQAELLLQPLCNLPS